MSESEHKIIEILRILNEQNKPTGSKLIAEELKNKGFNLGERAVRYHMQILDEKDILKEWDIPADKLQNWAGKSLIKV